ncbi:MAG: TetR/AcrR family transcriptional regulator [Acholeplasma sp.]
MTNSIRLPKTQTGYKSFYRILKVSRKLFAENGFLATSTNEIIAEAKVAIGTFYIYFDDKRAVYDYLLNDYSKQIRKAIQMAIQDLPTREAKERVGLKTFINFSLQDRLSYRIIWESMFVDRTLFQSYYTNFAKVYVKNLQQAVESNEVDPNIDLETLAYALMGISNFVGLQILFKDKVSDEEIDKIIDQVMYFLKHGMFTNLV